MRKIHLFILSISVLISSCSTIKSVVKRPSKPSTKIDKIVAKAFDFKGVKYRYGGTTKKGVDCSGIVYVAYASQNITLPRVSREMAKTGKKVPRSKVQKGDLLFFNTSKRQINHVGLVVSNQNGVIRFIHSTSSRGVIVSSLSEKYWNNTFVKAVTIL